MTRITVDINDEWLDAAQHELGTKTKVATVNEALHSVAQRRQAKQNIAILDSLNFDFSGSEASFRYGGGRDLSRLIEKAREEVAEANHKAA